MSNLPDKNELGHRLDKLVSLYVRAKEKRCFTCGKVLLYSRRQAGHYIPRVVRATRWDIKNVHVQCAACNVEKGGNIPEYEKALDSVDREYLDDCYEKYKKGKLKEPSFPEMIFMYESLLEHRDEFEESVPLEWLGLEWLEID